MESCQDNSELGTNASPVLAPVRKIVVRRHRDLFSNDRIQRRVWRGIRAIFRGSAGRKGAALDRGRPRRLCGFPMTVLFDFDRDSDASICCFGSFFICLGDCLGILAPCCLVADGTGLASNSPNPPSPPPNLHSAAPVRHLHALARS